MKNHVVVDGKELSRFELASDGSVLVSLGNTSGNITAEKRFSRQDWEKAVSEMAYEEAVDPAPVLSEENPPAETPKAEKPKKEKKTRKAA